MLAQLVAAMREVPGVAGETLDGISSIGSREAWAVGRRFVSGLCCVASLAGGLGSRPAVASEASCRQVLLVGVRGSAETSKDFGGFGETAEDREEHSEDEEALHGCGGKR